MPTAPKHTLTATELQARWESLPPSPLLEGVLDLLVRRPTVGQRELVEVAELDPVQGMLGDSWFTRGTAAQPKKLPHPDTQLTLMNSRVAQLIAGSQDRWALAGDQLYVDLNLSLHNLPPGTRLAVGTAQLEVTPEPHTGCQKFVAHFGAAAMHFVNSPQGRLQCLRGVNARVIVGGILHRGDRIVRL